LSGQYQLFFTQRFKGRVLFGVPMSEHTSFRVGGPADVMTFPEDDADLKDLIVFAETKDFNYHILGGGTNLLVRDGGVRGIVINMADGFKEIVWSEGGKAVVGSGVKLKSLVGAAVERGLAGLEFASGIPGTVGGAVVMNAGAYGGEMKDVLEGVEVMGRKGRLTYIPASELDFSYRYARIPERAAVVRAHMRFVAGEVEEIKARAAGFVAKRRSTPGIRLPNAGSIFKNPDDGAGARPAGQLIDEAGLKGASVGGASVSSVHANYIVNNGGATARDVLSLMAQIRDTVYGATGVVLEPEIKVIGEDL
jgi:UDP-N-acetylmuramate dehydrogenase